MQYVYDPFILRRVAEGRIFVCSPKIPFEFTVHCFQLERPFFLVAQLEDGRVAITPNVQYIAQNFLQAGYGTWNVLPTEFEYVTIKNATYPLILTAHPVTEFMTWLRKFETQLGIFVRQTLFDFVEAGTEFEPLKVPFKKEKLEHMPV